MKVFLTGATGFVGSHLLRRLLQDGHSVRALVRRPAALRQAGVSGQSVEQIVGDITDGKLREAAAGCDALINLVGIIYEHGKQTFEAVHHLGTKNLVEAARASGIKRFVQMSALGARPGNASLYHTTKFAAEEEVRKSGIPFVILRPSLIFGPGSAFVQQMISVMQAAPLLRPVAGTGKYRFRPVDVHDVAECFARALTNSEAVGQTIDLVGGEELTLDEIAAEIAACLNIHKTAVHIPIPVMKMAAAIFSALPIKPPITAVQVRMLEEGSTASPTLMQQIFRITPVRFREGIKSYLIRSF
jgi:NADH dehydrogenase